jgi:EAL domain-containing protein (putative c-di-GMP-specific phosphodiesterase class I)
MLPDGDGIQIIRSLHERARQTSIIIVSSISGKVLGAARMVAQERGFRVSGVFSKPLNFDSFSALLRRDDEFLSQHPAGIVDDAGRQLPAALLAAEISAAEIVLHYQPKIDLASGELTGVEALVRWQHPHLGLVYPDFIIPYFEQNDSIHQLTSIIIEKALDWFSRSKMSRRITLAINLSARDLAVHNLADRIGDACTRHGISPKRVILELTETGATSDSQLALATLTRLRIKGFGLALDDFGSGYASIVQLARMPFSSVKVDRSFVCEIDHSREARKIVKAIIGLGHSLGLDVVAEGVETVAAARQLHELGADSVQGFLMARPMSEHALPNWLSDWCPKRFSNSLADATREDAATETMSDDHESG